MLIVFWMFSIIKEIPVPQIGAMWVTFWTFVYEFLANSVRFEGFAYHAKGLVRSQIANPILEFAWARGIHSYKPLSLYTQQDLAELFTDL